MLDFNARSLRRQRRQFRLPPGLLDRARDVPIESVIGNLNLRGKGPDRVGPCPNCGGKDRFGVNLKKNLFNCRGCDEGGDVIALVQFLDGVSFVEAIQVLTGEMAREPGNKAPAPTRMHYPKDDPVNHERKQRDKARDLFGHSIPAAGTPVETYLRGRGITVWPLTARYLAPIKVDHHPAMLMPYGLPEEIEPDVLDITASAIMAVQLTLLKPDGSGKADADPNKISIGSPGGMPMVLAPMNDLMGLMISEGVEDALSVHQATGLGAWASGGWPFLPKLITAIETTSPDCITIYADADPAGQRGACELADILVARKIDVLVNGLVSP